MPSTLLPASMLLRIGGQEFSTWRIYSGQLQNKRKLQQVPAVGLGPRPLNTSASAPGAPPTPEEPAAPIKVQTLQARSGHEAPHLPRLAPEYRRPGRRIKQPLRLSQVSPKSPSPLHAILDPEQGSTKTCHRNQPSQQTYHPTTEHLSSFLPWGRVTRKSWIR